MPGLYGVDRVVELYPKHCTVGRSRYLLYPETKPRYELAVSFSAKNTCRRWSPIEDRFTHIPNFGGKESQAYWGVFDGSGGPEIATMCKDELGQILLERLPPSAKTLPPPPPIEMEEQLQVNTLYYIMDIMPP
ncbi:hypothetical protein BD410DRAFT_795943 [Rickenella mellea]|uniref:PPM-type phosphatase domain-containing protein n=1 Tax=Rickenella mellea TaxID=50990 RepID=A0A4Y7PK90_9AGAM|nr:hypothetical protein BD410DRAFT_795943 [Rickenella mellea]